MKLAESFMGEEEGGSHIPKLGKPNERGRACVGP